MVREADLDVVMLAGRWTLLDRSGAPLLAACAEHGVAVVAAAPYNSGLLARDWPGPAPFQLRAPPWTSWTGPEVARGHLPTARQPPPGRCPAVPLAASGGHRGGRRDADSRRGQLGPAAAGRAGAGRSMGGTRSRREAGRQRERLGRRSHRAMRRHRPGGDFGGHVSLGTERRRVVEPSPKGYPRAGSFRLHLAARFPPVPARARCWPGGGHGRLAAWRLDAGGDRDGEQTGQVRRQVAEGD